MEKKSKEIKKNPVLGKSRTTSKLLNPKRRTPKRLVPRITLDLNYSLNTSNNRNSTLDWSKRAQTSKKGSKNTSFLSKSKKNSFLNKIKKNTFYSKYIWYQKDSDVNNESNRFYGLLNRFKKEEKEKITEEEITEEEIREEIKRIKKIKKIKRIKEEKAIFQKKEFTLKKFNFKKNNISSNNNNFHSEKRPKTAIIKGFNSKRFYDSSSNLTQKTEKKVQEEYKTDGISKPKKGKFELKNHKLFFKDLTIDKNPDTEDNNLNFNTDTVRTLYDEGEIDIFEKNCEKKDLSFRIKSTYLNRSKIKLSQGTSTSIYLFEPPKVNITSKIIKKLQSEDKSRKRLKKGSETLSRADFTQKIVKIKEKKLRMLQQGNRVRKRAFMDNYIKKGRYLQELNERKETNKDILMKKRFFDPEMIKRRERMKKRDLKRKKEIERMGLIEQERIRNKRLPRYYYRR